MLNKALKILITNRHKKQRLESCSTARVLIAGLCNTVKGKKYNIIYADPPWKYENYGYPEAKRGCRKEYRTMSITEIMALGVRHIAAKNCVLFLWVTFPILPHCLKVFDAWGFQYVTCAFVWVKTNKRMNVMQTSFIPFDCLDSFWGMGYWTRGNVELCLLGIKGKLKRRSAGIHQIIYAPVSRHSKKPDIVREKIVDLVGDLPRIELFARQETEGWDTWGNEVQCDILLNSQ